MVDTAPEQRCPRDAVFAVNGRDRTILACEEHLFSALDQTEKRDGIGVFWRSDGQCFARVKAESAPQSPAWKCSDCSWNWTYTYRPYPGAECDNCGGELEEVHA